MAVTLTDTIIQLQNMVKGLTDIREAPVNPPESANQYPFSIAYPSRGNFEFATKGWGTGIYEITLEVHYNRSNLPKAVGQAITFHERFIDLLLADVDLSGTVTTVNSIGFEFGQLEYGSVTTIGWLYTIRIKQLRSE